MLKTKVRASSQLMSQTVVNDNILDSTIELLKLVEGAKLLKQDTDNSYDAQNNKIKDLLDGEELTDAATFGQVKAVLDSGSTYLKRPCNTVSMQNLADLSNVPFSALDSGVASLGHRILVWRQLDKIDNGIYEVSAVNGTNCTLIRAEDANADLEMKVGILVWVIEGVNFIHQLFALIGVDVDSDGMITIGTEQIEFVRASGLGMVTMGDGLTTTTDDYLSILVKDSGGILIDPLNGLYIDSTTLIETNYSTMIIPTPNPNGITSQFTLSENYVVSSLTVYWNGIALDSEDFTIDGFKKLNFITAPALGDKIRCSYFRMN